MSGSSATNNNIHLKPHDLCKLITANCVCQESTFFPCIKAVIINIVCWHTRWSVLLNSFKSIQTWSYWIVFFNFKINFNVFFKSYRKHSTHMKKVSYKQIYVQINSSNNNTFLMKNLKQCLTLI